MDMQPKILQTRSGLGAVRARIAAINRTKQMLDMTELQASADSNGRVWQGIGKMFRSTNLDDYRQNNEAQAKNLNEQIEALKKKEVYFATTLDKMILATKQQ